MELMVMELREKTSVIFQRLKLSFNEQKEKKKVYATF